MVLSNLIGMTLFVLALGVEPAATPTGPPARIVLPVIAPDCDRTGEPDVITVCGRDDRRFRIDAATLTTLRIKDRRDDNGARSRPLAITQSCQEAGPFACRGQGVLPVSGMALKAVELAIKAIRGDDLRPALRQGPTDYEIYQQVKAQDEAKAE